MPNEMNSKVHKLSIVKFPIDNNFFFQKKLGTTSTSFRSNFLSFVRTQTSPIWEIDRLFLFPIWITSFPSYDLIWENLPTMSCVR